MPRTALMQQHWRDFALSFMESPTDDHGEAMHPAGPIPSQFPAADAEQWPGADRQGRVCSSGERGKGTHRLW